MLLKQRLNSAAQREIDVTKHDITGTSGTKLSAGAHRRLATNKFSFSQGTQCFDAILTVHRMALCINSGHDVVAAGQISSELRH